MSRTRHLLAEDDPQRWAERGREAYALGLPRSPACHEALCDQIGQGGLAPADRDIPADVARTWLAAYEQAAAEHPEWRQCAAPACDRDLPTFPDPGWRRKTCSARCRVALSEATRGVRVRRAQQR